MVGSYILSIDESIEVSDIGTIDDGHSYDFDDEQQESSGDEVIISELFDQPGLVYATAQSQSIDYEYDIELDISYTTSGGTSDSRIDLDVGFKLISMVRVMNEFTGEVSYENATESVETIYSKSNIEDDSSFDDVVNRTGTVDLSASEDLTRYIEGFEKVEILTILKPTVESEVTEPSVAIGLDFLISYDFGGVSETVQFIGGRSP